MTVHQRMQMRLTVLALVVSFLLLGVVAAFAQQNPFDTSSTGGSCTTCPAGKDGKDGAPGRDGVDGKDGRDGEDGSPGPAGRDGKDGVCTHCELPPPSPSLVPHFDQHLLGFLKMETLPGLAPNLRNVLLYKPKSGQFAVLYQMRDGTFRVSIREPNANELHPAGSPRYVWTRASVTAFAADGVTPVAVFAQNESSHTCWIPFVFASPDQAMAVRLY